MVCGRLSERLPRCLALFIFVIQVTAFSWYSDCCCLIRISVHTFRERTALESPWNCETTTVNLRNEVTCWISIMPALLWTNVQLLKPSEGTWRYTYYWPHHFCSFLFSHKNEHHRGPEIFFDFLGILQCPIPGTLYYDKPLKYKSNEMPFLNIILRT
jgi:hypothetical protein